MWAICSAESGLNPKAISRPNKDKSIDWGICQINDKAHKNKYTDTNELLDTENNIRIAKIIKDDSGWNAWTVFKSGAYKKYIK